VPSTSDVDEHNGKEQEPMHCRWEKRTVAQLGLLLHGLYPELELIVQRRDPSRVALPKKCAGTL
jgi:hypothetical protein